MQENKLQHQLDVAKFRTWMCLGFCVSFFIMAIVKEDNFSFYMAGLFGSIALVSQLLKELITVLVEEKKEVYKRLNNK